MAVMTSLPSDGVELEHKTQPVPSSDKMALDLDINGTTHHDEAARDIVLPHDDHPTKLVASRSEQTNGAVNVDVNVAAVAANSWEDSLDLPETLLRSEVVEQSQSASNLLAPIKADSDASDSLPTTNTITTSINPEVVTTSSQQHALTEELVKPPANLLLAPTSVPPTVQAPESDVRDQDLADLTDTPTQELTMLPTDHQSSGSATSPPPSALHAPVTAADVDEFDVAAVSSLPTSVEDHPLHPASVSNLDLNQTSQTDVTMNDVTIDTIVNDVEPPPSVQDTPMIDAPESPSKMAREREDDVEDGPSAKRAKTGMDDAVVADVAVPLEAPVSQNGEVVPDPADLLSFTPYQQKELIKIVKSAKNSASGKGFAKAVADLWPSLKDSYLEKISQPMDLSLIENRLKEGYASIGAFKRDVALIYENAFIFNGATHDVTAQGKSVRDNLLAKIPGPEPIKPERKRKATPVTDPTPRAAPARRQSRGAAITAVSPTTTTPVQTFALDPSGTPLIRRDSTKGEGGRPKREIHPPKSKDLIYSARPKKKKFALELKFCEEVLNELKKAKYVSLAAPFKAPVDPVALGIPDYFKIIKTPMDLSTVASRLQIGQYESAKDFETDMRLIFKNCYKFNPQASHVYNLGKEFEAAFDQQWSKKAQWITDHTTSNAASPASTADTDEAESEDEPEEFATSLHDRLIEEQAKLILIMQSKKPDQVLVRMQQDMVAIVQKQVNEVAMKEKEKEKGKVRGKPKSATKRAPAATKKKVEAPKKAYKAKSIGILEKEQISAGIVQLEGRLLDQAVSFLKADFPELNLDDETELDIDQFSNVTLSKLHDLIVKNVPGIVPAKPEPTRAPKPSRPKKNKPMSKNEQESKIAKLAQLKEQLEQRQGSASDDAAGNVVVPSAAVEQDQSSGDESTSDSEED